tara:strand:- start:155 stop:853 length:699 start_codon:yes stop_codon:yes gene_type:complete
MKTTLLISTLTALSMSMLSASESFREDLKKNQDKTQKPATKAEDVLKDHSKESIKTANEQDELSADVQDLIQEQTDPMVVKLLDEAENLMGEATERLENKKTGGATIAIETEIIEKIYAAAKQKQKSKQKGEEKGEGEGKDPMLEMMEGMMGEGEGEGKGEGEGEGEGKGEGEGESGGEGSEGDSDKANDKTSGNADNTKEERRVPKSTSAHSKSLPREEQRALDAYNKSTK